jgi:selenocysteine lyase/cysteine desulfurase
VEVPVTRQDGRVLLRVSLQPYNRESDLERLEAALASLLPELTARPEADRKRA